MSESAANGPGWCEAGGCFMCGQQGCDCEGEEQEQICVAEATRLDSHEMVSSTHQLLFTDKNIISTVLSHFPGDAPRQGLCRCACVSRQWLAEVELVLHTARRALRIALSNPSELTDLDLQADDAGAKSTIALAFSVDGGRLASTHGDCTIKVFQMTCSSWSLMAVLEGHERTAWTVKFHPHSSNIIATGALDMTARVWDIERKQCLAQHRFDSVIPCVSFHPSGKQLAVVSGKKVFVWSYASTQTADDANAGMHQLFEGTPSHTLAPNPVRAMAFNRTGLSDLFIVATTNPGTPPSSSSGPPPFTVCLRVWRLPLHHDFTSCDPLDTTEASFQLQHAVLYSDAGFSVAECGHYLAVCELEGTPTEGMTPTEVFHTHMRYQLKVFSLRPGSLGAVLQVFDFPNCPFVTSVQFSPLAASVLVGFGKQHHLTQDDVFLRCFDFHPRSASGNDEVHLGELGGPIAPAVLSLPSPHPPTELFAISSKDGLESNVAHFHPHGSAFASLAFLCGTKDGRLCAFTCNSD